MAKPRARTIQQRFGFMDNDLKTELHDNLMLELDKKIPLLFSTFSKLKQDSTNDSWENQADQNIECFTYTIQGYLDKIEESLDHSDWQRGNLIRKKMDLTQYLEQGLGPIPKEPAVSISKKVWEYPIKDGKYIIGFVDLKVLAIFPYLDVTMTLGRPFYSMEYHLPKWSIRRDEITVCFEVKSAIQSLGEAIRQIRMYQVYENSPFYIVCPDAKYARALTDQGIGFICLGSDKDYIYQNTSKVTFP